MFHRKRRFRFFALMLPVLVLAGFASGCRCRSPEGRAEWVTNKVAKHLDLDDQQKAKLNALKDEFLKARAEMKKERAQVLDTLIAQAKSDRLDQKKLQGLVEERTKAIQAKSPRMIELLAEFHASLNAEQKEKIAKKLGDFREHLEE